MKILESYQMIEMAENIREQNHFEILAKNLKEYRLSLYEQYAKLNKHNNNPYSSENIASLLGISRRHYKRLENPNYITKNISLEKLLILRQIYNISLDDFFNTTIKK